MPRDDRLDLPVPAGAQEEEKPARAPRRSARAAAGDKPTAEVPAAAPTAEGAAKPRRRQARPVAEEAPTAAEVSTAEGQKPATQAGPSRRRQAAQQAAPADAPAASEDGKEKPAAQQEAAAPQAGPRRRDGGRRQGAQPAEGQRRRQEAVPAGPAEFPADYAPRLRTRYVESIAPALVQEFGYSNPMQVPVPKKVVLNIGVGEAKDNARALEAAQQDLGIIAGQKPVITKARRSVANFKIREGMSIGTMVTLRGSRMWDFLDRLMNVALPRMRDFRGVSAAGFDGRGNYSLGLREQIIFPEVDFNQIDKIRGLQINIVTSARNDGEGRRLLELLGMPFAR